MNNPLVKALNSIGRSKTIKSIERKIAKNLPEILVTLGVVGLTSGTIIAVANTPKAMKRIEIKKEELQVEKLTAIEVAKTTWPCYLPVLAIDIVSITAVIFSNRIKTKRYAALAALYQVSTTAFETYKDKVIKSAGEEMHKKIETEANQEQISTAPSNKDTIFVEGSGCDLCYDVNSDRYFWSDKFTIKQAENAINRDVLTMSSYSTVNELYDQLGLKSTAFGYDFGWTLDDPRLDIKLSSVLAPNGKPCLSMSFKPFYLKPF